MGNQPGKGGKGKGGESKSSGAARIAARSEKLTIDDFELLKTVGKG